ncbi:hypothetical protein UA08_03008 [Talaromyces atroroseus]|uniref:INO80 complex subunit F domain-containing protein n=1 Tax=Talaromyces atroroseus TaxID=1441469 RepID=A0A225B8X4_TALAT|nr:hypothetical protein UA08_03008 [Talaromyces atroroseus]OKL62407.1 hypothetical protein UA08_03008 [Talaromyces atroroseus]
MDEAAPSTAAIGSSNTSNPPSIELAYKKKCIQLKKRLNEIEAENDLIRARNKRAQVYVAKMRLETCIMLERLATVTGMLDEAAAISKDAGGHGQDGRLVLNSELRAKAAAIVQNAQHHAHANPEVMDDETEGSSEDQPPTPQERPLRVKRSRKSNIAFEEIEAEAAMQYEAASPDKKGHSTSYDHNNDHHEHNNDTTSPPGIHKESSALPSLAPATPAPAEERRTSGFRAVNRMDSNHEGPVPMDVDERPSKTEG